jgi:hypothetical protein
LLGDLKNSEKDLAEVIAETLFKSFLVPLKISWPI